MVLDDALIRLRRTGPERDGWLSNHAPMAVEAWLATATRRCSWHPAMPPN
ncbi:hypothetical protein AB0368_14330 [Actinoplanes sp. NPDC051475]